ncbi:zinc finger protein 493-like isoform X1 [Cotesia glomerata]|uniref:C2H2-type domain-containing protein n=2 Tax=Cotesia glomerata TaxID=32391 RepID=A0AAV7IVY8_COTGL|nr:zinc finger protein 493-like isoform X1 [Cotesia glomerata]KAH0561352.1 hypothetical protein KQX54_016305 [Cotesia glomerata]
MNTANNFSFEKSADENNTQGCEIDDDMEDDLTYHYSNLTQIDSNAPSSIYENFKNNDDLSSQKFFFRSDPLEREDENSSVDPLDPLEVGNDCHYEDAMNIDPFSDIKKVYDSNLSTDNCVNIDESLFVIKNLNQDSDEFYTTPSGFNSFSLKEDRWTDKYKKRSIKKQVCSLKNKINCSKKSNKLKQVSIVKDWDIILKKYNPVVLLERITIPRQTLSSSTAAANHKITTKKRSIRKCKESFLNCGHCKATFTSKACLDSHLRTHVDNKRSICQICSVKFDRRSDFDRHLRIHAREKEDYFKNEHFKCEFCFAEFSNRSLFQNHMQSHMGGRVFKCHECSAKFHQKKDLTYHLNIHTENSLYECKSCSVTFDQKKQLHIHMQTHLKKLKVEPGIDSALLDQENHLNNHVDMTENILECKTLIEFKQESNFINCDPLEIPTENEQLLTQADTSEFKCAICSKKFNEKNQLDDHHMLFHTEKETLQREEILSVVFNQKKHLNDNMDNRAGSETSLEFNQENDSVDPLETNDEKEEFKCETCSELFHQKEHLDDHARTHAEKDQFKCDNCSAKFNEKNDLDKHMQSHANDKTYKCYVCLAKFTQKSHIDSHMRVHSDKRMFKCDICQLGFKRKSTLDDHLRKVHEGELPFKCDVCSAKFNKIHSLNVHKRIHLEEQAFACNICAMKVKTIASLSQHMLLHTDSKPFYCNICNMKFKDRKDVKTHKLTHRELKPFKCDKCPAAFEYVGSLNKHREIHTGKLIFECDLCLEKFKRENHLRTHKLIHSINQSFQCDVCSAKFSLMKHLEAHKQMHILRPFVCEFCPATYARESTYKMHMRRHANIRSFDCDICYEDFNHPDWCQHKQEKGD